MNIANLMQTFEKSSSPKLLKNSHILHTSSLGSLMVFNVCSNIGNIYIIGKIYPKTFDLNITNLLPDFENQSLGKYNYSSSILNSESSISEN